MQHQNHFPVDLSNCDKEPIHLIGSIQPHGFFFILNSETLVIEQVSANITYFLDAQAEALTGKTLEAVAWPAEYGVITRQLQDQTLNTPQLLTLQGNQYFGFLHRTAGKIVLECERFEPTGEADRLRVAVSLADFQTALNKLDSLEAMSNQVVNFVQEVLGYDRVMLYVFDTEWNGEVTAEKIKPGIHSYLFHHFPASDIPAPARDLLLRKDLRQIPDVAATPVPIVPYLNPVTGAPSDVLLSELRYPSEIHLEYLQNMGVQATLSVSIIVADKLWGIIACHHETPLFIDFWKRQLCNVVSKAFSTAILAFQEKSDYLTLEHYKQVEEALIQNIDQTGSISKGLFGGSPTLVDLTACTGAAICVRNKITFSGETPNLAQIREILDWLAEQQHPGTFHTRELSKELPAAAGYADVASGLLALEISKYNKEYILYFKQGISEKRIWAGNPDKPMRMEGVRIHPRKSFAKWEQTVKGKSLPWSLAEMEIAQTLQKDVIAIILRNQAMQLQDLNEELQVKNKRLEDFANIITHNLRSPLSNMRGLYALYQAEPTEGTGAEVLAKMDQMIDNMAATIDDLHQVLRTALDGQLPREHVNIAEIIDRELQNLEATIQATGAEIRTELQVQELTAPKVYLQSILHNLLSNALKYRDHHRKPLIEVKTWVKGPNLCLCVKDNGIGMDMDKVKGKLFGLYKTFNRNKDAKGLGLYLTKLQIEALGGKIKVQSEPNKGTTFTVSLALEQLDYKKPEVIH